MQHRHPSGKKYSSKKTTKKETNNTPSRRKVKFWKIMRMRQKKRRARKRLFDMSEYQVMGRATEEQLQSILQNDEYLSDIPFDCTLEELKGEIALAKGNATTIYIQRDGLATLTVVLPQENPTIANLKRGIESAARIQLKRSQRERYEDRLRRRTEQQRIEHASSSGEKARPDDDDGDDADRSKHVSADLTHTSDQLRQPLPFRNAGELVYSEAVSGQQHRPNVSWRFLWRAYALLNVYTRQPLNDANGRTLLSDCGVENATKLKFCNREKYFGKKRQR